MSDFQAIGGVSATLRTLLRDRMEIPASGSLFDVTVGPPKFGPNDNQPAEDKPRVNLFLYRVSENGFLQNQQIPGRESPDAYGHPPLSLNLHYLVTSYGNKMVTGGVDDFYDETLAHFLLGSAMRVLHDFPVITDRLTTIAPPSGKPVLDPSLRDSFEKVKLTLEPLTLEDITKVWTALALRYRLSAAYAVSVVQIESRRTPRFPRLVGEPPSKYPPLPDGPPVPGPMVQVLTLRTPVITEVRVRRAGSGAESAIPYASIGDTLVLRGTNLGGADTRVEMGDIVVPAGLVTNDRVEVSIPDQSIPGSGSIPPEQLLQPGPAAAIVLVHEPALPYSGLRSNPGVWLLVPSVSAVASPSVAGPRSLTVDGIRLYHETRSGETMVGQNRISKSSYAAATPGQILVPLPDTLPMRKASLLISAPLPVPVNLGASPQVMDVLLNGTVLKGTAPADVAGPLPVAAIPRLLQSLMRDVAPGKPAIAGLRVGLIGDRLVVVVGGMTDTITVAPSLGSTMAVALGLTTAPLPGAGNGLVSGELAPFPALTAAQPRLRVRIGASPDIEIGLAAPTSLADAASRLQGAIRAADPSPAFQNALVGTVGNQLVVVPGAAALVRFSGTVGDATSVAELALQARFAVRVRVGGAESLDSVFADLPEP